MSVIPFMKILLAMRQPDGVVIHSCVLGFDARKDFGMSGIGSNLPG